MVYQFKTIGKYNYTLKFISQGKIIFIGVLFILWSNNSAICQSAQVINSTPDTYKNIVYASGSLSSYFLLNYERQVSTLGDNREGSINLAVGLGGSRALDFVHTYESNIAATLTLSSNFISGGKRNHFEADIGLVINSKEYGSGLNKKIATLINLGYRFQPRENPNLFGSKKPFVFRTGIGYPYLIYLSFGFAF